MENDLGQTLHKLSFFPDRNERETKQVHRL